MKHYRPNQYPMEHHPTRSPEDSTALGRVIRTLDQQRRDQLSSQLDASRRQQFFQTLDLHREQIFAGIEAAMLRGETEFFPQTMSGFPEAAARIFGGVGGKFDATLMNQWLYACDVKHLFHCSGWSISW